MRRCLTMVFRQCFVDYRHLCVVVSSTLVQLHQANGQFRWRNGTPLLLFSFSFLHVICGVLWPMYMKMSRWKREYQQSHGISMKRVPVTRRVDGKGRSKEVPTYLIDEKYLVKAKVNDISLLIERQGESFSYEDVFQAVLLTCRFRSLSTRCSKRAPKPTRRAWMILFIINNRMWTNWLPIWTRSAKCKCWRMFSWNSIPWMYSYVVGFLA